MNLSPCMDVISPSYEGDMFTESYAKMIREEYRRVYVWEVDAPAHKDWDCRMHAYRLWRFQSTEWCDRLLDRCADMLEDLHLPTFGPQEKAPF